MIRSALIASLIGAVAGCNFTAASAGAGGSEAGVQSDARGDIMAIDARRAIDSAIDAPPDAASLCDRTKCSGAGGTCTGDNCVFDVEAGGDLACPSGEQCVFHCNSMDGCKNDIDCSTAASCVIDCKMMNACNGGHFDCSGGGCTLLCRDDNTCANEHLTCGAQTCDLECCSANACGSNEASGTVIEHDPGTCP